MNVRAEFYIKGRRLLDKPFHLKAIGLPNVYLLNGVSIEQDADYGTLIAIEDIPGLHRAVGLYIVAKSDELTGSEFRFLRKEMNLTQEALADRLRLNVQTVANYEKGKTSMGAADAAVRALYTLHILSDEADVNLIRAFAGAIVTARRAAKLPERSRKKITGSWREAGQRKAA